jgi:hypothetical protein
MAKLRRGGSTTYTRYYVLYYLPGCSVVKNEFSHKVGALMFAKKIIQEHPNLIDIQVEQISKKTLWEKA